MPPDVMRPAVEMALMNSTKALFLLLASLLAWLFQTGHHEPGHGTGPAVAASTVVEAPAAAAARKPRLAATIHSDQAWSVGHAIASRNGSRD